MKHYYKEFFYLFVSVDLTIMIDLTFVLISWGLLEIVHV